MHPMPALDGAVGCPTAINSQRVLILRRGSFVGICRVPSVL